MHGFWRRLFARSRGDRGDRVHGLYLALVSHARSPAFYGRLGVPDTPEGRFEMIGLHAVLLLRRLKAEGASGQATGQELFDLMFADIDVNLREIGVGDLSVGRYVKRMAQNFFARIAALDAGLARSDLDAIASMLRSNVYHGGSPPAAAQVEALARYLVDLDAALALQPGQALLAGQVSFVPPPMPEHTGPGGAA